MSSRNEVNGTFQLASYTDVGDTKTIDDQGNSFITAVTARGKGSIDVQVKVDGGSGGTVNHSMKLSAETDKAIGVYVSKSSVWALTEAEAVVYEGFNNGVIDHVIVKLPQGSTAEVTLSAQGKLDFCEIGGQTAETANFGLLAIPNI